MQRTRMPYFFLFRLDGGVMIGRVEVQGCRIRLRRVTARTLDLIKVMLA